MYTHLFHNTQYVIKPSEFTNMRHMIIWASIFNFINNNLLKPAMHTCFVLPQLFLSLFGQRCCCWGRHFRCCPIFFIIIIYQQRVLSTLT